MENRKKQNLCLTLGGMIVILAGILVTILGYKLNRDGEITAKDLLWLSGAIEKAANGR